MPVGSVVGSAGVVEASRSAGGGASARLNQPVHVHAHAHGAHARDMKTPRSIVELAFHKGLLVLGAGENSLRLSPPLLIDEEQADVAVQTLEECIREAEKKI